MLTLDPLHVKMQTQNTVSNLPIHECTRHPWPEVKKSALKYLTIPAPVFADIGKGFGCLLGSNMWHDVRDLRNDFF